MEVEFDDGALERLERDSSFDANLSRDLVKAFRKRIQAIRAAIDESDLYKHKSLHFEKLKGKRKGERSIRLNDQYRLTLRLEKDSRKTVVIIQAIEDYH